MSVTMRHLARSLAVSLVIAAFLTPALHAQPFPKSERQKAEEARKKADETATDEAYKAEVKRTQGVKKKADPWANLRTSGPGDNK
jgi:multidrug efflux pump subunit AcrB